MYSADDVVKHCIYGHVKTHSLLFCQESPTYEKMMVGYWTASLTFCQQIQTPEAATGKKRGWGS